MICEEKPGMASIYSVDSRTSCSPLEFHCATIKTASKCQRIIVHTVTLSSPSPVISCVESLPQGAHVSHIPVGDSEHGDSKSNTESTTSQVLRDVHIVRTHELRHFFFKILCYFYFLASLYSFFTKIMLLNPCFVAS
jgi:hypothetical protein